MSSELKTGRKGPPVGDAKQAVIFVHGYGADGSDLLGLADPLAPHMPDTAFLAPDAPEPCRNNPMGYQWFPIPWLDGSSEEEAASSMAASVEGLNAYFDMVMQTEGLTPDRVMLFGFSQGTMMCLHIAPRRPEPFAGLVGFSGRMLEPERLKDEAQVRLPVLLVHGDQDPMVPYPHMLEAADTLIGLEYEVYTHTMEGTGHGIDPGGLGQAAGFMIEKLGLNG